MNPLFIQGLVPTAITIQAINSIVIQELPSLVNKGVNLKLITIVRKYFSMKSVVCPHGVQKDFYNRTTSIMGLSSQR